MYADDATGAIAGPAFAEYPLILLFSFRSNCSPMPKLARAHHYVPKFLLAGFTDNFREEGLLWVSDLKTGTQWPSTPRKTGHRRDFYRVEVAGVSPTFIEQDVLSDIEARQHPSSPRSFEIGVCPNPRLNASD